MNKTFTLFILLLLSCNHSPKTKEKRTEQTAITSNKKDVAKQYEQLKLKLHSKKIVIANEYIKANGQTTMQNIIHQAKDSLLQIIVKDVFPYWYGTPWDFNGTTQIPQQGKIACGYFVTTVLKDAGFNIPRIKWAQAPSETIIKKICSNIKFFNNQPIDKLYNYINQQPNNVYIVGLDNHVGFIYKKGKEIKFVHSNYYQKEIGVMAQDLNTNNPLKNSSYRMVGILLNDETVKKWLISKQF